jgi:hypothetical protein
MYAMAMDGGAHGVSLDPTSQEPAIVSPNPVFGHRNGRLLGAPSLFSGAVDGESDPRH